MKRLVVSDEFIERMADSYRSQSTSMSITFQQFIERELKRLKEAIAV